jgi:DNA-binding Xre family transcriptional regulator
MIIINLYNIKWKKKFSRKEISEHTGLSPATVTKLTKGEHVDMKLSTLERIAKFFGCSVKDIIVEVPDEKV